MVYSVRLSQVGYLLVFSRLDLFSNRREYKHQSFSPLTQLSPSLRNHRTGTNYLCQFSLSKLYSGPNSQLQSDSITIKASVLQSLHKGRTSSQCHSSFLSHQVGTTLERTRTKTCLDHVADSPHNCLSLFSSYR